MVRGQWGNLARMPGLHPYSFSKDCRVIWLLLYTHTHKNNTTKTITKTHILKFSNEIRKSQIKLIENIYIYIYINYNII